MKRVPSVRAQTGAICARLSSLSVFVIQAKRGARGLALVIATAVAVGIFGRATLTAAPPAATGTGWDLVFADEFNGTGVDTVKWSIASPSWTMPNSLSTATASQVSEGSGNLVLNATRTGSSNAFTSGSVSTYGMYTWDGGYFEARIALPTTPGSWPAFWGLYNGWPPEADIMEYPLTTNGGTSGLPSSQYNTNFHYTNSSGSAAAGAGVVDPSGVTALNTSGTTYHTFGMYWVSNTSVTFYFDGAQVSSYTGSAVNQMVNMYLILDYAVGGWPGTPSLTQWAAGASDQTKVDYVRVWQQRTSGASTTSTWKTNGGGTWTTSGNWTGIVPKFGGQQAVFGQVGSAATASVDWSRSLAVGGLTFGGSTATTTAYTLVGDSLQLTGSGGTANANIQLLSTSTANQTINSRLELYNTTDITNNTSASSLFLNGLIVGDGNLTVSGSGPVQFANNNTYLGDTYIGTAATPAATAVVVRSRPFGTVGTLYLGITNNPNAARIQIAGTRTVPNTVQFAGRGASATDNATPAIQNLSDSNEFSGTLNLVKGGTNYIVQSDAGTLTLSGSADTATPGVALQVGTGIGGARTVTLQGTGSGIVSGVIANGSGTISINKTGTGTWTFSGANTYTGATTLTGGTLALTGSLASGGTLNAASGTVLTGNGTVGATTSISGTHNPGAAGVSQPFTGALTYGATGRLAWGLVGNTTGSGSFNSVAARAVTINSGAKLDLVFNGSGSAVDFTNVFWKYPQRWTVLTGTSVGGSGFAVGSVGADASGRVASNYGTFTVQQNGTAVTLVYTPLVVSAPQQPTGLTVTAGNNQVVLAWTAPMGAGTYTVLRSTTSGGPYTAVASGLTTTSYTDATAVNGTTYYYTVTANNSAGASTAATQASTTPFLSLVPYAADASTTILFHFDEAAGTSAFVNTGSLGKSAYSVNLTTASATPPVVTTAAGAAGVSGLGTATTFASGQLIGWDGNGSGAYQGDVSGTALSADAFPMSSLNMGNGGQTPWTIEAMVYCTLTTPNANQEIVCTDSSAASRGFQFRLNASGQLELNLLALGKDIVTALPTTGTHAYAANVWFHVAATYDGTNIRFYWTRADSAVSSDNLISTTAAAVGSTFGTVTGPLCIGGENRGVNGESFQGRIDEVRISSVARAATAMLPAWLGSAPPALAAVPDQTMAFNTASGPITLTLSDIDSPVNSLTLSGAAANPSLIPVSNIVFGGSGASRTVVITPAANVSGTTTITLTVSDGLASSARTFNVTVLDQAYSWRQQFFGANWNNDAIAGDMADPDGDGMPNLLERAFGGNPNLADSILLPVADNTVPFSIDYYKADAATDLIYTVQESPDLSSGSWTTSSGTSTDLGDDGTVQTIRFTTSPGSTGKKFLRVLVTKP